jgi:hypothetical protein
MSKEDYVIHFSDIVTWGYIDICIYVVDNFLGFQYIVWPAPAAEEGAAVHINCKLAPRKSMSDFAGGGRAWWRKQYRRVDPSPRFNLSLVTLRHVSCLLRVTLRKRLIARGTVLSNRLDEVKIGINTKCIYSLTNCEAPPPRRSRTSVRRVSEFSQII